MGTQMGAHLTLKIGDIIRLNYMCPLTLPYTTGQLEHYASTVR